MEGHIRRKDKVKDRIMGFAVSPNSDLMKVFQTEFLKVKFEGKVYMKGGFLPSKIIKIL